MGRSLLFWVVSIFLWEGTVHLSAFDSLENFLPGFFFSLGAALVASFFTLLPGKAGRIAACFVPPILFLFYAVQLVYHHIFSAFLSLSLVSMGGEAMTQFWGIVWRALVACLPRLLLLALPVAGFYLLRHFRLLPKGLERWQFIFLPLGVGVALSLGTALALPLGGTGPNTHYAAFASSTAPVDRWVDHFGVLTAEVLDLRRLIFGGSGLEQNGLDLTAGGSYARNVLPDMDLEALSRQTEDAELKDLIDYCAGLAGTGKNAYTGRFKDYNLIVLCAEAFSPYLVDPELTPTLYRLSNEGFVFRNFYNSFPSVTTDGEYSMCMGLMTDTRRVSFAASMDNYVPFCLGNQFTAAGRKPMAYHNNIGTFYNRANTHPNMGYTFKAVNFGLDMAQRSPASDLEMMEKTVDDYLHDQPFHAYYMTYSGHAFYNFTDNEMSVQNQALVEDMDGPDALRAYYACQLELERALTYLMERLEEAGAADHTVIVLSGDHMPYGLPEEDYQVLAGDAVETDPFWRYRNSFICWAGDMEEPVVVDDYCCTQDILPTLLNLFGLPYDSRMLTGRDVLSDCTHIALLKDGSFLSREVCYDSSSGELIWPEGQPVDADRAQELLLATENQFTAASAILGQDLYRYAFSQLGLSDGKSPDREKVSSFADIAGRFYEDDVEFLTGQGILVGDKTGNFHGEEVVNRATTFTMIARWLHLDTVNPTPPPYSDVKEGDWFYATTAAVWKAGLLPENIRQCRPKDPLTAQELTDLLTAIGEYLDGAFTQEDAVQAVEKAMAAKLEHNPELPEEQLSRGALATALAAVMNLAPAQ